MDKTMFSRDDRSLGMMKSRRRDPVASTLFALGENKSPRRPPTDSRRMEILLREEAEPQRWPFVPLHFQHCAFVNPNNWVMRLLDYINFSWSILNYGM